MELCDCVARCALSVTEEMAIEALDIHAGMYAYQEFGVWPEFAILDMV
jgi:hypothetical protein